MTVTFPVVAPAGTIALICVDELTAKLALTPLNLTDVVPVKFVPLIFTLLPTVPLVGEKLLIVGPGRTVNAFAVVAVPEGVLTAIGPVTAPAGTAAVI